MKKILTSFFIIIAFILFQLPAYSSDDLDLGDYTEDSTSAGYGPFNLFIGGGLGIGMPAGDLLETEKDLLSANDEEYDGVNYFHSFAFNLNADSVFRLSNPGGINFSLGIRGLLGYYMILHKLNTDSDDYDSDDYDDKDYMKQLLSFGQLLAGPCLYIGSDSGFSVGFHVLYGKIFGGRLTTQPLVKEMYDVDTEESDFSGRKLDIGFGISQVTKKIFFNFNFVISMLYIELDDKPLIYNDRIEGSETSILDLSLVFAVGFRLF